MWRGKPARPVRLTLLSMLVGGAAPVRHSVCWNIVQPIAHQFGHGDSPGGFLAPVFSRRHLLRLAYHAPVSTPSSPLHLSAPFSPQSHHDLAFAQAIWRQRAKAPAASPPAVAEMRWSKGPSGSVRVRQGSSGSVNHGVLQLSSSGKYFAASLAIDKMLLVVVRSIATPLGFCLHIHIHLLHILTRSSWFSCQ